MLSKHNPIFLTKILSVRPELSAAMRISNKLPGMVRFIWFRVVTSAYSRFSHKETLYGIWIY